VVVVGDSLEVGSAPHLRAALGATGVDVDAEPGRTSSQGVGVLARRLRPEHRVVVFPLGTNDTSAVAFAASLAAVGQLAGGRCVVVATIARRPLRGSPAGPLNRVVEQFAAQGAVQVADWRAAAATPGVLGRDGTHATGRGYALRASLIAEAVQGCLAGAGAGGIPAPKDPNVRVPPGERRDSGQRDAGQRDAGQRDAGQRDAGQRDAGRTGAGRGRPEEPRARPLRLPARAMLLAVGSALRRAAVPVAAALRDARTAATMAAPEPILGRP
jgi:hypothetical protein